MTALILLACLLLAGPVGAASPKAGKSASMKGPLASLKPPATPEERELFKTVKGTAAVSAFLLTRQFVREAEAKADSPPPLPKGFDFKYMVSIDEMKRYYGLGLRGTFKEPVKPKLAEEKAGPLKELEPPATEREREMFAEIQDKPEEIKKFLITRKFIRELEANPQARAPEDIDFRYMVSVDEQGRLLKIVREQRGF